jgi:hypothetical protein
MELARAAVRAAARASVRAAASPPPLPTLPRDYFEPGFDPATFRARGPGGARRGFGGSRQKGRRSQARGQARSGSRGASPGGGLKASSKEARRGASGRRASTPGKGGSSTEEETSESENDEAAAAAAAAAADATWRAECEAMAQQEAMAAVGRAARLEVTRERAWEPGGKGRVRCVRFSLFVYK